jgi:hypothetical protein
VVDHQCLHHAARRFQPQAKLLLDRGEKRRRLRIGRRYRNLAAELRFIWSPVEVKVVPLP